MAAYTVSVIKDLPIEILEPLSITMSSGNEIVFFGDRRRRSKNQQSMIVYNIKNDISQEYTVLSDDQNYKSVGVAPYGYCVFKRNKISSNSCEKEKQTGEEYISMDRRHFSIYKNDGKNSHTMKNCTIVNKMNDIFNAMCFSLFNRNDMCFYICFLYKYISMYFLYFVF